ncbi:hypothetical protein MKSMC1_28790 [Mycobacterium kansasii]|nr:hypothetical protein MKSMC1_28790 [Mycobacterium kansasii]
MVAWRSGVLLSGGWCCWWWQRCAAGVDRAWVGGLVGLVKK